MKHKVVHNKRNVFRKLLGSMSVSLLLMSAVYVPQEVGRWSIYEVYAEDKVSSQETGFPDGTIALKEEEDNLADEADDHEGSEESNETFEEAAEDNIETIETAADVDLGIQSPSVILMEPTTGQILYEKNADERRHPASVTKVMTLLLIFEQLSNGQMTLQDTVTVSEHAASMGGSQCFFEVGETQTVEDMIKCIIIASGNDAAVAMGEHIAGSESAFVQRMNERAQELGMANTHFENACGLDAEGHLTTARDIAVMSRELTTMHPEIFNYSSIWMDTITHVTRRGASEFGLANTNKLLKAYPYCTGLKTGYTSAAGFSISATASKDGIGLIAVILGAPTKEIRNADACRLFDYGFASCSVYQDSEVLPSNVTVPVQGGKQEAVSVIGKQNSFAWLLTKGQTAEHITKEYNYSELTAPIKAGDVIGEAVYFYDGTRIGAVALLAGEDVEELTYLICFQRALMRCFQVQNS